LAEGDSDSEPKLPEAGVFPNTFAVIDTDRREHAIGILNVNTLVRATEHVEEEANKPEAPPPEIIANSAATGLLMLADATEAQQQTLADSFSTGPTHGHTGTTLPPDNANALLSERMSVEMTYSPTKSTDGRGITSNIAH
jgi:hypothetical protein